MRLAAMKPTYELTTFSLSLFQALGQWGRSKKRAGDRGPGSALSLPDPARRQPAFSIVHTDREPGTGYFSVFSGLGPPENLTLLNVTQRSHNTSTAMVTWLPPHNLTDIDAVKEYKLSWTKMPIMSKQTSQPHSDSTTLDPVSFLRASFLC